MAKAPRTWTCQRVTGGEKCGATNLRRFQICRRCGKRRPATKKPDHMRVLDEWTRDEWMARFGDRCMICGASAGKRALHRDHDHRTGAARGLLCFRCNSALRTYLTVDWMKRAIAYLERADREAFRRDGDEVWSSDRR